MHSRKQVVVRELEHDRELFAAHKYIYLLSSNAPLRNFDHVKGDSTVGFDLEQRGVLSRSLVLVPLLDVVVAYIQ